MGISFNQDTLVGKPRPFPMLHRGTSFNQDTLVGKPRPFPMLHRGTSFNQDTLVGKPRPFSHVATLNVNVPTLAPSFQRAKFHPPTDSRMSLKKGDLSRHLTVPQWTLKEDSGGAATGMGAWEGGRIKIKWRYHCTGRNFGEAKFHDFQRLATIVKNFMCGLLKLMCWQHSCMHGTFKLV